MRKFGLLGTSALRSAVFIGFATTLATGAMAQDSGEQDPPETLQSETEIESGQDAQEGQTLVVTGSRIRRPNLESSIPITSIGGEEFFQQGQTNIGDTLNELPQLRSTFGQQNAGRFLGTTGLNLLDLRGLGTQRTLVLVNGRRHVAADILNNAVSPDVNTIPNDLIERVDIVTGGNSAIYGSDAIAGVVNFILRRDFEGIQVRGQAGISEEGYGANQYVSAMGGMNFADDRGNVTVHAEYAHADRVFGSDISFLRQNDNFVVIDSDTGGLPNGSDGFPDRAFFRDLRQGSIDRRSMIPFSQPTGGKCGTGNAPTNGPPSATGTPFNCNFIFTEAGLIPQTGTIVGSGPIGARIGGNGLTGREGRGLSVLPFQERMNFNLLGRFEFSPAAEAFLEAKYVKVNTQGQQSSPAFIQGGTLGDPRERPRLDNPYLAQSDRNIIVSELLSSGFITSLSGRRALTQAERDQIAAGTYRFTVLRFLEDLGFRDEASERQTYRIVGGLRGSFNDDWSYEVSANYGRVDEDTTVLGNIIPQRFMLAMDAVRDPATGQIRCRSQVTPNFNNDIYGLDGDEDALAAEIASCVPYNPFGFAPGQNAEAAAYITEDTVSRAKLEQWVLSGFVSGDSSQLFELPGGPARFALGAEYRREKAFYQADPIIEQGRTFYNALPTFSPPAFEVKEAFAEVQLPVLRDMPFFEDLTLSAAGRVADYKGATGTVFAYNAGVEWAPIRDIRFRANYGRSVRAPNYTETAFPLTQNFAPGFADPCLPNNIAANPNRAANCLADLGAILNDPQFQQLPGSQSPEIRSGSNPDLNEETSDSFTIGAVIQPRFVPGLSLTVDYFDIKVEDVITSVSAQAIVNGCYDAPSLDNPFCPLFERAGPGGGPDGEAPGELLSGSLLQVPLNFAALKRRGVDVELAYRQSIGENSRIDTRFIYTHQLENSNFTDPSRPEFENRILGELGDPQDEFRWDVDFTFGDFTLGYQMQYIGSQVLNLYEDFFPLDTACTPAGCPPNNLDYADIRKYPDVFYHDLRFEWRVRGSEGIRGDNDMNFYVGVDNIFDKEPPFGLTGVGGGSGIYKIRGRNYYAGFRARF